MTLAPDFEGFTVRFMPAPRALKAYICPECGSDIPSHVGHVVAWPAHDAERRRHWHQHCWRHAVRRGRVDGV